MAVKEYVSRYRWVILALAFISQGSNGLSSQAVAPLAPLFQPELGLTNAEVGLFYSAVYAGAWGVLLVAGFLTDRFGIRKMMSLGQIAAGVLMLSMAAVGSFLQALAVMFVAGLGRGAVAPGVTKAVMDWFPPRARATAMGLKQTSVPLAGIATAATLPALGLAVGWRTAIVVVGLFVVLGGIATAILYRDTSQPEEASGRRVSMRASLGAVVRNRNLWVISGVAFLFSGAQAAVTAHLALYLKEVVLVPHVPDESTRIVAAGGYLAVCQVGGVLARIFWGIVSDRVFGGRRIVVLAIVGALSMTVSLALGILGSSYPLWLLTAIVFTYGAGAIGWGALYLAVSVEMAGRKHAGTGVGLSMTLMQGGTIAGAPLFGFIVDVSGSYQVAWLFLACLFGIGTITSAVMARGERQAV